LEAIKLPYRITNIKNNSFDENQENQHNHLLQTSSCNIEKVRKNGFFFYNLSFIQTFQEMLSIRSEMNDGLLKR